MANRIREVAIEPTSTAPACKPARDPQVLAVARAGALFAYLVLLKVYLASWYILSQQIHPLAEVPKLRLPLLVGGDLALCALLAVPFAIALVGGRRLGRAGRALSEALVFGVYLFLAVFTCFSTRVNQVYGWPLDIHHLRAGGNLQQLSGSIAAYVDWSSVLLLALAVGSYWLFAWPIGRALARLPRLRGTRLWIPLLLGAALVGGAWLKLFQSYYAYGLKKNAILHFVQYYEPAPRDSDARALLASLDKIGLAADADMRHPVSLIQPQPIPRDFIAPAPATGYNVLFILLESTSRQFIDPQTTPHIAQLMEQALRFDRHFTTISETFRAVYALFYSDPLTNIGVHPADLYGGPLPQRSLPEVFAQAGYATGIFHTGYLDYGRLRYFFEGKGMRTLVGAREMKQSAGRPAWMWGVYEENTVDVLSAWIEQRRDQPFFAVYSTIFPHHPYVCPSDDRPFGSDTWEGKYRNSLHYVDANIGRLLSELDRLRLRERTLIVIVGDHGETVSHFPVGHGLAMTTDEVRVPMIYSNPMLFPLPQTSHISTNHLDVAPTLAALVGLPGDGAWLGRNLLADTIQPRLLFVDCEQARLRAVIDNGIALLHDDKNGRSELVRDTEAGFVPLPPDAPQHQHLDQYRQLLDVYGKWAVWRQLHRALATPPIVPAAMTH